MIKKLLQIGKVNRSHLLHAGMLALIFGLSLFSFLKFKGVEVVQLYIGVTAVLAYISWGIFFHYYHKRLSWSLVLEYVLVGALVVLLVFWLLSFS